MHFRFDQNILLLWLFLILQIIVVICYLSFSSTWKDEKFMQSGENLPSVKFMGQKGEKTKLDLDKYKTYYNSDMDTEVYLKSENVNTYFILVNNTICFKYGTDIGYMHRNMEILKESGKCECLPEYHGNDCSLPEVIWRAFIASRQETVIHKRMGKARRIVLLFKIAHPAQIQQAIIKINELFDVVDLFIVTETNKTEFGETKPFYFKEKLDGGTLKSKQFKILLIPLHIGKGNMNSRYRTENELAWAKARKIIRNFRDDDLFIHFNNTEIPNSKALLFFKLYDGFSLPIHFRLKWNVYGYYFQHPKKTRTVSTGCTIHMLNDLFGNNPNFIQGTRGLTVGDLNHYGGWFCELCYDPNHILDVIQTFGDYEEALTKTSDLVDVRYIQGLIGDGLYVDGKTGLIKNSIDRDSYYSPSYVANNSWKYDSLITNFYNIMDYN